MDETRRPPHPTRPGPVAEGQIELSRELAQRSPAATREQVQQEQETLQRDRPEVVREAARPVAGGADPEERARTAPQEPADAESVRSPFADAAAATRDLRGEAG
jgi:hypothetical protein